MKAKDPMDRIQTAFIACPSLTCLCSSGLFSLSNMCPLFPGTPATSEIYAEHHSKNLLRPAIYHISTILPSHPLIHTRPIRQQAFPSKLLGRRPYLCNIQTNAAGQPFLYIEQLPFTALNHKPHFKRWKGCFQNTQTLCNHSHAQMNKKSFMAADRPRDGLQPQMIFCDKTT